MQIELPLSIETKRLIIRKYRKGDGESLFDLLESNDNREYLKDHADEVSIVKTIDDAEVRIRQFISDWVAYTRFVMGIWMKSSKTYIGQIWIEPKKWEVPSFELGWFLERTHQGKGIATEAAKGSIEFIFDHLNAHKIIVFTRDDNVPSYKLAERCGFSKEGYFKDHSISNGKRYGLYCYALFKHEYIPEGKIL